MKNLGKIIWLAIFLVAITALIVYGPKKSVDFVQNQLSFALTPGEKWGIKEGKLVMEQEPVTVQNYGLVSAKDFHGTTDDLKKMSDEQLIFLLETDRYGPDDDKIALSVLKIFDEKANNIGIYGIKDQKLFGRLQKVLSNILGYTSNLSGSEVLYAERVQRKIRVLHEF